MPKPNAIEINISITATTSCILCKVTFFSSFLPKYAPAIAASVAEIKSVMFSCRFAVVKREA